MHILGINAYHGDSSACLIRDGLLVAAAEEERFCRFKHWAGFPYHAIDFCLREAGIELENVQHIALNQDSNANLFRKIKFASSNFISPKLIFDRIISMKKKASTLDHLSKEFDCSNFKGEIHSIEHHYAHLSSAFFPSPFEKSVVLSVDGFGDFASTAWGVGNENKIDICGKVFYPHSLGKFYQALTQYLGFSNYGDEYKVMGLAPYGKPTYLDKMCEIVLLQKDGTFKLNPRYFHSVREKIEYQWETGIPSVGKLWSDSLSQLLGPSRMPNEVLNQRHFDIAQSVQSMYEKALFHLLNSLHAKYNLDAVAIAGGCGMNSVANGKICRATPFERVYIQAAAGDAGGSIGAALAVWHKTSDSKGLKKEPIMHAYWGPSFSDDEVGHLLLLRSKDLELKKCTFEKVDDEALLCKLTAESIASGQVIGWFQGRMEWGPRALGNRSILGDPRRADMKDILNLKIKRRESFRPFAPSILREDVSEWFEDDADVPFMMQVFQIRESKRALIPAVTHVDGSGRLQTVHMKTNPRYYRLICEFRDQTGIPLILNTSFNENEPVVCYPEQALETFLRTKMDLLVMEGWMIRRHEN